MSIKEYEDFIIELKEELINVEFFNRIVLIHPHTLYSLIIYFNEEIKEPFYIDNLTENLTKVCGIDLKTDVSIEINTFKIVNKIEL